MIAANRTMTGSRWTNLSRSFIIGSVQPAREIFAHEIIIRQIGVEATHTGEFFGLTRREVLFGVKAPDTFEQTLATQDLVAPCDAEIGRAACRERGCQYV